MPATHLGRMLVIANPAARSGKGEAAALFAMRFFSSYRAASISCEVCATESPGDAERMAVRSGGYDTVVALGGDGIIHEVVCGLMCLSPADRPRLGVIPMGTGNDFARTLTLTRNSVERSIEELLAGTERAVDVGRVNDTHFIQTLSFGLDAQITLETASRRADKALWSGPGASPIATAGLHVFATSRQSWNFTAVIDGEEVSGADVVFAVQNGPTYGGGFRICPDAVPNDGLLDLCFTTTRASLPRSVALFGLARLGRHTRSRKMHLARCQSLEIVFTGPDQPPCQVDGERLVADRYVIGIDPGALRVIVPKTCIW